MSCTLRFILPASSAKMRSFRILASSRSATRVGVAALGAQQHQQARTDRAHGFARRCRPARSRTRCSSAFSVSSLGVAPPAEIQQLKDAYRTICRGLRWNEVLQQLDTEFPQGPARKFLEFFAGGNGASAPNGARRAVPIPVRRRFACTRATPTATLTPGTPRRLNRRTARSCQSLPALDLRETFNPRLGQLN